MATEKQKKLERWLTAAQFAALAGRPGDQHFIKNKVNGGKIIKCPRLSENPRGGKPAGLWPESYVLAWVAQQQSKKISQTKSSVIAVNREIDTNLALAFICGHFDHQEAKESRFF